MVSHDGGKHFIEHKSYARVGLLGNPSDVYFGRTISFSLGNFWARVRLEPSNDLVIEPHPHHDLVRFDSLGHLVNRLENEGCYGGVRLLMTICKVFYKYCSDNCIVLKDGNFTLSYDTNIPRQTGLSGSSAIVCAALSCFLDFYKVRHLIKVEIRPDLILSAEKELGIVAGLQDRVAQVYGGLVYMDFGKEYMDKMGYGLYTPMDISLLPPLHLIYAENPSDSGKVHSTVRKRWLDGDKLIISSMEEVAKIALDGRSALLEKRYADLAQLMNRNFDLRRQMFGDEVLGSLNLKMIQVVRSVGAAAKFTGSGGAIIAFCPEGPTQVKLLEDACQKAGFVIQPAVVVPSLLNDEDHKTLSRPHGLGNPTPETLIFFVVANFPLPPPCLHIHLIVRAEYGSNILSPQLHAFPHGIHQTVDGQLHGMGSSLPNVCRHVATHSSDVNLGSGWAPLPWK